MKSDDISYSFPSSRAQRDILEGRLQPIAIRVVLAPEVEVGEFPLPLLGMSGLSHDNWSTVDHTVEK
jgi:hypothetical protein